MTFALAILVAVVIVAGAAIGGYVIHLFEEMGRR